MFAFKVWLKYKFKATSQVLLTLGTVSWPFAFGGKKGLGSSTKFFYLSAFYLKLNKVNRTICVLCDRGKGLMKM